MVVTSGVEAGFGPVQARGWLPGLGQQLRPAPTGWVRLTCGQAYEKLPHGWAAYHGGRGQGCRPWGPRRPRLCGAGTQGGRTGIPGPLQGSGRGVSCQVRDGTRADATASDTARVWPGRDLRKGPDALWAPECSGTWRGQESAPAVLRAGDRQTLPAMSLAAVVILRLFQGPMSLLHPSKSRESWAACEAPGKLT